MYMHPRNNRPSVKAQTIKYDKNSPTMSTIEINLGSNGYQASSVAVAVNGEYINKDYLSYNDGKLTISPDAFKELSPGTYQILHLLLMMYIRLLSMIRYRL